MIHHVTLKLSITLTWNSSIRSQIIHERWYASNLDIECCERDDRVSICKYLVVVRKLMDEKFTYMKHILSIEKDIFVNKWCSFLPQNFEPNLPSNNAWYWCTKMVVLVWYKCKHHKLRIFLETKFDWKIWIIHM